MRRGDVYMPQKVEQALSNFFRRGNLIALRELALRQVAEQVDRSLENYMADKDIQKAWAVRERLAVCVGSDPSAQYLIARGARLARRLDSEFYVIHVETNKDDSEDNKRSLAANLKFAENLGAKVILRKGVSVADTVSEVVREKHITQVIFGRSVEKSWRKYLYLSPAHRFLRESPEVDVHIVTQEKD
jgi:two-component system, OmpR family, sensor histidine kinase KdpD